VSAENAERQARERMNIAMGLWGAETYWSAQGRMPDPPVSEPSLEDAEVRAVEQSLVLDAARRSIDAARSRLGLARVAGAIPGLEVGVSAAREGGHDFVGPSVRIGVPVFDQGQGLTAIRNAELQREQARYIAIAVRVRARTRAAREQLIFARNRVEWFRTVQLPLRQRIVEQSLLQYNAMQIGVFQLLQSRRDQMQAGREYIGALRDYWIARAVLSRLVAGGSPDGDGDTASMESADSEGSTP
jgi:cobalt-zinc-cadmium efflux system outer membrane protein